MTTLDELRVRLADIAERSVAIKSACTNEESTKLNLVLPVIEALGYDYRDPFNVQPEYVADFRDDMRERVDFVIMRNGNPVIAMECKRSEPTFRPTGGNSGPISPRCRRSALAS